jgi:hypothetical protein
VRVVLFVALLICYNVIKKITCFLDKYSLYISLVFENNAAVKRFENCNVQYIRKEKKRQENLCSQFIDARVSQ